MPPLAARGCASEGGWGLNPPAARAQGVVSRMVLRAIEVGGTCSGEHGIGVGKLKYLRHEHGDGAVDAMHAIKRALDPNNILNPGKIGSKIPPLAGAH